MLHCGNMSAWGKRFNVVVSASPPTSGLAALFARRAVLAVELSAKAGGSRWLFPWQGPADLYFIFFRHLWGCTVPALLRQHTR